VPALLLKQTGLLLALALAASGKSTKPAPKTPPAPAVAAPDLRAVETPDAGAPRAAVADGGVDLAAGDRPAEAKIAAPTAVAPATDETFDAALAKHFKGDFVGAASGFFLYLRGSAKTADRYEWAEHFLSQDLDQLGLSQAALEYEVFVAEERARPEVLPDALTHLEKLITAHPYPRELIEDELLHGTDFGPLPAGPRSFVGYYQGLVDYRLGQTKWGEKRFAKVEADSPYAAKVRYLKAVYRLVHDRDEAGAHAEFTALADDVKAPAALRNQAYQALARLAYEGKDYAASYALWGKVKLPELDPGRAPIFLERAWNLYRLKKYGDAMGLLYALEAPTFRDVFLPEKYLLRSLIYKDLCHYLPAKRSAREFSRRFAGPLSAIHTRTPLSEEPRLLASALQLDETYAQAQALLTAVKTEQERLDRFASPWTDSGLFAELQRLYGLLAPQATRREQVAREAALKAAADKLLTEEEQLRLQDYEVGLAMYARLRRGRVVTDAPRPDEVEPDQVVYDFDGEYWNDELRDFHLFLTSRCLEQEAVQ
jgi:hypothetical protein